MNDIADMLSVAGREWRQVDGASEQEISMLRSELPFDPPLEYLEFLRYSNGGEGELALEPLWFQLFDVSFAIKLWKDESYRDEYPDLFFFGSNGGMESIAFDMSQPSPWPIVMVDCVAGLESLVKISENFNDFIDKVGVNAEQQA